LGTDERWIDEHESGLRPAARNGRYWGLGQLDMAAFTPTLDPCVQIADQRAYMTHRYGSWSAARAHWESHSWW